MKRRDLIKRIEANGYYFLRSVGDHDIYTNGKRKEPIGRHTEIEEGLAKKILKRTGQ